LKKQILIKEVEIIMKKNLLIALIICSLLAACSTAKKTTTTMPDISKLAGTWELNYISGPRIAFDGLYPGKKPTITFDIANNRVSGSTGCNNFNGPLKIEGNKINFNEPMAMTRMMCPGEGENVFMGTLKKINTWSVTDGNTLNFIMGDIAMMRFVKK
jgi:heat shock protein HslJ